MSSLRSTYSKITINQFEYVGSYIVGVFWGSLYDQACMKHNNTGRSITEIYRDLCIQYSTSTTHSEHMQIIVAGLHTKIKNYDPALSYGDMINHIVKELVPPNFFPAFSNQQKQQALIKTLQRSISRFTVWVLEPATLKLIIDRTGNTKTVSDAMQDKFVEIMCGQRDECYRELARGAIKEGNTRADPRVDELKKLLQKTLAMAKALDAELKAAKVELTKLRGIGQRCKAAEEKLAELQRAKTRIPASSQQSIEDSMKMPSPRQEGMSKKTPARPPSPSLDDDFGSFDNQSPLISSAENFDETDFS